MKTKILLTSALALAISAPAMAADPTPTTVTSTSSCTETTLGTATGPVDIEADWQANTINLTWDANNGTVSGIQDTTCTYADTFELPTSITRTGYEFAGWLVKNGPAQCSASVISSLNANVSTNGSAYGSIALSGNSRDDSYSGGATAATYGISNKGEWGATFSYGIIRGKAVCSGKSGDNHIAAWGGNSSDWTASESELTSASGTKQFCWCQLTDYTPTGGEMCAVNSSSSWGFSFDGDLSVKGCEADCAYSCANYAKSNGGFRAAVFGLVAN